MHRAKYGSAPVIQFNKVRSSWDYTGPIWIEEDVKLISEATGIHLFHYGPRLWMLGEIGPLRALQATKSREKVIERILNEYPTRSFHRGARIYRLRVNPTVPHMASEYDSPPSDRLGSGRLDSRDLPVLYCSQDVEGCVHECRVTVEDTLYLATLVAEHEIKLLDLTELLKEEYVNEFESLDMAVHMLFFAAKHSYEITQDLAKAAFKAGFDGFNYPSYFSQIRSGNMPFETVYGISVRRFPGAEDFVKDGIFRNFGANSTSH